MMISLGTRQSAPSTVSSTPHLLEVAVHLGIHEVQVIHHDGVREQVLVQRKRQVRGANLQGIVGWGDVCTWGVCRRVCGCVCAQACVLIWTCVCVHISMHARVPTQTNIPDGQTGLCPVVVPQTESTVSACHWRCLRG